MRIARLCALALAACLGWAAPAFAQDSYPNRSIKIIVPIPPGGAPDIVARLVGQYLSQSLGQPVVIENRSGANGNLAGEVAAKSPADGYTLLLAADSGIVINPHVYAKMTFDPMKDLVPISTVATNQFILAVNPKLPVKTLSEFVDYAKKANPPLSFANGGVGSQHFFAMEQLKQRAGFSLLNVTFRGGSPAMQSTVAGDTQVLFAGGESGGQFESGNLRPLAASGKERSKRYPNLPTIGETYPGYAVDIWLGLFAPAGTPAPIIAKLQKQVQEILARPDVAEKINVSGSLQPLILSPDEFAARIRSDDEKFSKLAKELNLKIE
ncbi:tripartite tricarboxylate transporter substrate binding protein [Pseudolabrys taiwanensis]|uniref:Tripartite tricarboxylate transporter substrate binding protein n=1 Tax=Pseudolabrys taiwanensis TaxID=331696 RepID=A0A345ZUP1_9HYPH|nr:tripartite tricarboxylate transporter substrate binding protein [Pseudolabrys taiwanensis]AXK80638.1 tripartite tricarboxylate transporter substrate binding protein [Pseudolabrys taiwanensis]